MENHNEQTKQLLALIEENPTLRVFPMVHYEVVAGDDYGYWGGKFERSSVEEIYIDEERIWIRSEDECEMIERFNDLSDYGLLRTDEEAEEWAKEQINNCEWEKVIVLRIGI